MAYLTGLEYPVNSVGELPLPFIDADDEQKAKALLVNARQILEMYRIKEEEKMATEFRYKPYHEFATAEQTVDHRLTAIQHAIQDGQYEQAIQSSDELIKLALRGLRYLQTYDWLFLRTLITAGYVGWIVYAFTTAVDLHVLDGSVKSSRTTASIATFASLVVALYSFLYARSSPPQYYAYAFFPLMFWEDVFARRQALVEGKRKLFAQLGSNDGMKLGLNLVLYIGILEVMVSLEVTHHLNLQLLTRVCRSKATTTAKSTLLSICSPRHGRSFTARISFRRTGYFAVPGHAPVLQ
jgi:phosphatidylinositol glycan class N